MTQTAEEILFNNFSADDRGELALSLALNPDIDTILKSMKEYAAQFQQPTGDYMKEAEALFPFIESEDGFDNYKYTQDRIARYQRAAYIKGCMRNLGASVG